MTVTVSPAKGGPFSGNGVTTSFPFSFRILEASHLRVFLTNASGVDQDDLVLDTDYSVTFDATSGSVTYPITGSPLPTGWKLTVLRNIPIAQSEEFPNNVDFFPETHEMVYDKQTMIAQQLNEEIGRCVKVSASSSTDPDELVADLIAASVSATAAASAAAASETNAASSAASAAASATAASTALNSAMFRDVVFLTSASSPYAVSQSDNGKMLAVDTTGGNVTVNLAQISSLTMPFTLGIKKTSSDGNVVTINRGGADTIDGATSKVLSANSAGATFLPDVDPSPDIWTTAEFGAAAGNKSTYTATGNGVTTVYTLPVSPGSANNVLWFEGGVFQKPGVDFTLSGVTLTRTSAPANGVSIFAIIGSDLAVPTPGDGTVTGAKLASGGMTSAQLRGALSDETGSGAAVFATSPTLVTPVLGVASATSITFGESALGKFLEGTYTPTVRGSSVAGTPTYTVQTGDYQVIGGRCHFSFRVVITNLVGATGGLEVSMPFAANAAHYGSIAVWYNNLTTPVNSFVLGVISPGSNLIDLYSTLVSGAGTSATLAIDTAFEIIGSGSFRV